MPPGTRSPHSNRVPLIVAAALFMETLDASIIVTALPSIAASFHERTLALGVGISAYLIAAAVLVPTAGWVSERCGARNVFAAAVATFTVASLLCGLSPTLWSFVASRVLQGSAAAFMSPVGRLIVLRETPKERIIESLGMIVWPALIGPVVGPPLGGFIATYASWHWIFFINLPIGAIGLWLVLRFVPRHAAGAPRPFDLRGFLYAALALAALIEGLSLVAGAANPRGVGAALVVSGLVFGVLAVRHARRHAAPLLDLQAAADRTFMLGTLSAGLLARVAIQATPFLLPLMFQIGFGASAFRAGTMLLVYMAGNLLMKSATTGVLRRFGYRRVAFANGLLGAAAIAACALLTPAWPLPLLGLALLLAGMTRSMQFTTLNTMAFADIAPAMRGSAVTMAAVSQQIGAATGVAFATLALSASETLRGADRLGLADFEHALWACAALLAIAAVWLLGLPRDAGAQATAHGMPR